MTQIFQTFKETIENYTNNFEEETFNEYQYNNEKELINSSSTKNEETKPKNLQQRSGIFSFLTLFRQSTFSRVMMISFVF